MPELPEVETIVRGLNQAIVGKRIKEVKSNFPSIVKQDFDLFRKAILHKRIKGLRRRGKYLLIDLSVGKTILVHLGMTGNLRWIKSNNFPSESLIKGEGCVKQGNKHDHLIIKFYATNFELRYKDLRKFGRIKAFDSGKEKDIPELKKLGPEALNLTSSQFIKIFRGRKGRIKSALLNQKIIAGLGNIYADESLFEAEINPEQKPDKLCPEKLKRLHKAILKILKKAIRAGGSSVENYFNIRGEMGNFQLQHKVYGREGKPCKRCGTRVKRIKINKRSSFFCPRCQS